MNSCASPTSTTNSATRHALRRILVDVMVVARFRQQRLWNIERDATDAQLLREHDKNRAAMLRPGLLTSMAFGTLANETRTLDLLNRYESRFDRQYLRAHRRLLEVQERRLKSAAAPPSPGPQLVQKAAPSPVQDRSASPKPAPLAPTQAPAPLAPTQAPITPRRKRGESHFYFRQTNPTHTPAIRQNSLPPPRSTTPPGTSQLQNAASRAQSRSQSGKKFLTPASPIRCPREHPRPQCVFPGRQWYLRVVPEHYININDPLSADSSHSVDSSPVAEGDQLDPAAFVRHRLGLHPDPPQLEVLLFCTSKAQGILNCTRQWGKSTIAAAKAVHRAYTQPGSEILVASPSERQSAEFLRKASRMVSKLGIRPRGDGDNAVSLLFPNGSRIVGLPGNENTVRGFSAVSLLLIDEASWVDDSLYKALHPMLATTNGDLWLLSTPCGKRGFFYEEWKHGGPGWFRISVPATKCPCISAEFLENARNTLEPDWFAQEYMAEFVDNGFSYFSRDLIEAAIDPSLKALKL